MEKTVLNFMASGVLNELIASTDQGCFGLSGKNALHGQDADNERKMGIFLWNIRSKTLFLTNIVKVIRVKDGQSG